uniref:Disease resistance protein RPP8-Lb n=1 Tax=Vitis vinifera TaxID=29760 RepID=A0A876EQR8_VITVI|nr:disease resistance protein RPP8-Lb [Vitis vinifera]
MLSLSRPLPEDWVIPKRELLLLWITEGFIPQQDEQRMEDTAEDYLNELINRNLIQVVAVSINERIKKCRVHDLVRDLCIKKAKKQKLFEIQNNIVHVPSSSSSHPSTKCRRQGILNCIVLNLEGIEFRNRLSSSVGRLIHLTYLSIKLPFTFRESNSFFSKLPTSLGNLRRWQTLDIGIVILEKPTVIQKMKNLRHLFLFYHSQDGKPLLIDSLSYLQTLSNIWVSDWRKMIQFSNSIAKLENLRSLYLEAYPPGVPSFVMNSWLHLSKLQIKGRIPQLPHARQFPPSLTQLTLEETELDYDPMAILEKRQKLLTLRLRKDSYLGEEMQVSAHGFPRLKVIQLFGLNRMRRLNIEKGGMSKLTQLQVFESVLDINGLSELLLLQKVDVITTSLDHHP